MVISRRDVLQKSTPDPPKIHDFHGSRHADSHSKISTATPCIGNSRLLQFRILSEMRFPGSNSLLLGGELLLLSESMKKAVVAHVVR